MAAASATHATPTFAGVTVGAGQKIHLLEPMFSSKFKVVQLTDQWNDSLTFFLIIYAVINWRKSKVEGITVNPDIFAMLLSFCLLSPHQIEVHDPQARKHNLDENGECRINSE